MLPDNWIDIELAQLATLAPVEEISLPVFHDKKVRLSIKREDLLHPLLGGNKLYKLHAYLKDYLQQDRRIPFATFGGAHSNHIIATAVAAKMCGIPAIGIIRGERPERLSATLLDAQAFGMRLEFVSRTEYRRRYSLVYRDEMEARIGPCYWVPEGGAGTLGAQGLMALADGITMSAPHKLDVVFHACGTGTSLAGLTAGFARQGVESPYTYGVSVLKSYPKMAEVVAQHLRELNSGAGQWQVLHQYHGGGYAKLNEALALFMLDFEQRTRVPLDPVYTAKVMWAIVDLVERDFFPTDTHILLVHSGGLQGRRGFSMFNGVVG